MRIPLKTLRELAKYFASISKYFLLHSGLCPRPHILHTHPTQSRSGRPLLLMPLPTPLRRTRPSTPQLPRCRRSTTPAPLLRLPTRGQPNKANLKFRPRPPNQAKPPCPRPLPLPRQTTCPLLHSIFLAPLQTSDTMSCSRPYMQTISPP